MPTYPYGTKGGPAVGGALPGIPRKKDGAGATLPAVVFIDSGAGEFKIPAGYSKARIAVLGAGGAGANLAAGGGAGLAATTIITVTEGQIVSYSVGAASSNADGGDTVAKFGAYVLVGGGGKYPTSTPGGVGGVGTGGDVNYNGGKGGDQVNTNRAGGGGAAGLGSNGGDGGSGTNPGSAPAVATGDLAGGGGGAPGGSVGGPGGGPGYPGQSWSGIQPGSAAGSRNCMGKPVAFGSPGPGGGGASSSPGGSGCVRIELWP